MAEKPIFSIITVCLNAENKIENTILSVINQSFEKYEFIIIDGGSNDKTIDLIKKYKNNVGIFISEKDNGIYDAMNKGVIVSNGKYLFFLNAGDLFYDNNVLRNINDFLTINSDISLLYGKVEYFNGEHNFSKITGGKINFNVFWKGMPICHQTCFFHKKLFEKLGLYDLNYRILADYEFLYRYFISKNNYGFNDSFIDLVISKFKLDGINIQNNLKSIKEVELINKKYIKLDYKKRIYYKLLRFEYIFKNIIRKNPRFYYFLANLKNRLEEILHKKKL